MNATLTAQKLIDVRSAVSAAELCDAIQDAGFIATPVTFVPGTWSVRGVVRLLLRAILFGVLGGLGTAVGIGGGILNMTINPECTAPSDEGARAMGLPLFAIGLAFLGGGICGGITLIRGGIRLFRTWRAARQEAL